MNSNQNITLMNTRNTYEVTPTTARFIDALRAYSAFQKAFDEAMTTAYGQDAADTVTARLTPHFSAIDHELSNHLMNSIQVTTMETANLI